MSLPDFDVRRNAIMTSDHSFVWASAGTGKTHTLTLRALYLLLNGPFLFKDKVCTQTGPELYSSSPKEQLRAARDTMRSLALTTFTRKAAAEMHDRLYHYLDRVTAAHSVQDLEYIQTKRQPRRFKDPLFLEIVHEVLRNLESTPESPALLSRPDKQVAFKRLKAGAQALVNHVSELQVSTMHSLAASILRRHPLHSDIPPSARFAREDEDDLSGITKNLVKLWWQHEVIGDSELEAQLGQFLQVLSLSQIRDWLENVYKYRWIVDEAEDIPLDDNLEAQQLVEATFELINLLEEKGSPRFTKKYKVLRQILDRIDFSREKGAWRDLCLYAHQHESDLFLDRTKSKILRRAIGQLSPEHSRYFRSWANFRVPASRICLVKEYSEVWHVWMAFLRRFVSWAEGASSRELGLTTFDEMIDFAVRLLERYPSIRRAEQARLRAILVDELQDTDPQQLRLLKALLKRDSSAKHEVLGFFVGDTKQSIYRFRGADVPSIIDFHKNYEAHTGCRLKCREFNLTANFRSSRKVTAFLNRFFGQYLSLVSKSSTLFPIRTDQGLTTDWVWIDSDETGGSFNADRGRQFAGAETVRIIREIQQSGVAYKDILVLVRDGREIDSLVPLLHQAGVPAVSLGAKTFYRQPEVLDALNFLIVLLSSQDQLATVAVLRSPLICLSDPDIHTLLARISAERLFHSQDSLPAFLTEGARSQIETVRGLVKLRCVKTFSDWFEEVRAFIPFALYVTPEDREGRALVRINRILDRFSHEIKSGTQPPLVWLLKQRERSSQSKPWNVDAGEDVTVENESMNAIKVMTIHKAKGLEARFVVVCGWTSVLLDLVGSRGVHRRPRIISLTTEGGRQLNALSLQWGPIRLFSSSFIQALKCDQEENRCEAKRLAYVATTRARDRLILVSPTFKRSKFSQEIRLIFSEARSRSGPNNRIAVKFWDGALRLIRRQGNLSPPPEINLPSPRWDMGDYMSDYRRVWKDRYEEFSRKLCPILMHPSDQEHGSEPMLGEQNQFKMQASISSRLLTGRLVHAYLEHYLLDGKLVVEKLLSISSRFPELSVDHPSYGATCSVLSDFYGGSLVDKLGKSYRQRVVEARVVGREVPFYLVIKNQAWNGIIDLVLEKKGEIFGIDYKSTSAKNPLPDSYRQQKHIYTEALQRLFPGRIVKFEFWWLRP